MSGPEGGKEENDSRGHVFSSSEPVPSDIPIVRGCSFSTETTADDVLSSYATTGFQATHFARACAEVERMLSWRLRDTDDKERELLGVRVKKSGDQDGAGAEDGDDDVDGAFTEDELSRIGCRIFLGYTSNMVSSGVRETVRYLAERRFVDVIVSSAGGIEEDFIKCLAPCFVGSFDFAPGPVMRRKGLNRTGNLVVPNDNYCLFEDWLNPILDAMLEEQNDPESPVNWTPSKMIARLGKEIGKLPNCEESVYYWCYKNGIPVFSPAITDGSIGDVVYFHSIRNPGLRIDIAEDIRRINDLAVRARRTGQIILGGGLIKHHVQNANLMRNGSHYSVFVNTGQEFDGSDSGAKPDEALSWGKIHISAKPVKVCADASLVFPLLVQQVFVKWDRENGAVGEDGVRRGRGDITT